MNFLNTNTKFEPKLLVFAETVAKGFDPSLALGFIYLH